MDLRVSSSSRGALPNWWTKPYVCCQVELRVAVKAGVVDPTWAPTLADLDIFSCETGCAPMSRNSNNNHWYKCTWFIGVFHPIFNWWNPITVGRSLGHIMSHQCFAAWICPKQDWMGWEAICWDDPDLLGSRALVICWKTIVAIMTFPSPVSQSQPTGSWDYKRAAQTISESLITGIWDDHTISHVFYSYFLFLYIIVEMSGEMCLLPKYLPN